MGEARGREGASEAGLFLFHSLTYLLTHLLTYLLMQGTKASLPKIDLPNWMKVKGGAVAVKEKESLAQPFVPHMRLQMGKF